VKRLRRGARRRCAPYSDSLRAPRCGTMPTRARCPTLCARVRRPRPQLVSPSRARAHARAKSQLARRLGKAHIRNAATTCCAAAVRQCGASLRCDALARVAQCLRSTHRVAAAPRAAARSGARQLLGVGHAVFPLFSFPNSPLTMLAFPTPRDLLPLRALSESVPR
jgi:hypothetical protein